MNRRSVIALGLAAVALSVQGQALAAADTAAPPPELTPGAVGVVRTVLQGTEIEELPLVYLGTYPNFAGPGLDLYIVRLSGDRAERVGIAAGMSGSPVYIDGRMIGALAYRLGSLPKSPIAGVTPIADMRSASRHSATPPHAGEGTTISAIATPVFAGGLAEEVRRWASPTFDALGLVLVSGGAGGAAGAARPPASALVPGSPVGVELVRGDLHLAATGTVTWVEGDSVWAFGHPFLSMGPTEMPMVTANVIHTVEDLAGSFKLSTVGDPIGAVLDDRPSAVVGRLGATARMMPLHLEIRGGAYGEKRKNFEIVRNADLAPVLAGIVVANSLLLDNGYTRKSTLLARGVVRLRGLPELPLDMAFSAARGEDPAVAIAASLFGTLNWLWRNPFQELQVEAIELSIAANPEPLGYRIRDLHYDRGSLALGEPLTVRCVLSGFRGPDTVRELRLDLPAHLAASDRLTLVVGSPDSIDRALGHPLDLQVRSAPDARSLVRALSASRSAHRLTALVLAPGGAVVSSGVAWAGLPPSAERLLALSPDAQPAGSTAPVSPVARAEVELDGPVEGLAQIRLRLERTQMRKER